ncbi:HPr kinase/phosphatase C-terminal domain-containing protein [Amaricoccus sp.]|uniref:HPr kinase/phosphorylase n=1 Tax=Amaricoccus sp. TaxID=1872485 RepID=UPI003459F9DC
MVVRVGIDVRILSHRRKPVGSRAGVQAHNRMSRSAPTEILHASAVALGDRGLLILGASGAGKSGLALRMMALGARLVADDRVAIEVHEGALLVSAPAAIRGMIEARGVGLLRAEALDEARLALAVDLDADGAARMPQSRQFGYHGVEIELISGRGVPNLDATLVQMLRSGRAC